MSLEPTGKGQKRWANRWMAALNAFEITFDGRLAAGNKPADNDDRSFLADQDGPPLLAVQVVPPRPQKDAGCGASTWTAPTRQARPAAARKEQNRTEV
jgi:hypothetical protein